MIDRIEIFGIIHKVDNQIKRESIPTDKRINKIVLTEEGRKKYEEVDADLKEYKHQLLKDFSDEEIDLVYSMLQKISDNTKK